jgi:DNA-binding CsgD family transcriptional regulator/N-acetylneuraminic acid mutarotase
MTDDNGLSEREIEILRLVATGASNKEIAQKLVISPNTVKVHTRNIFAKIGVVSRTEATLYAIQHRIVASPNTLGMDTLVLEQELPGVSSQSVVMSEQTENLEGTFSAKAEIIHAPAPHLRWWSFLIGAVSVICIVIILVYASSAFHFIPIPAVQANPTATPMARWRILAPMPEARSGLAAVFYGAHIYAIGGKTANGVTGSLTRYDLDKNTWETQPSKPLPVTDIQAVLLGEKVYVPGGLLANGQPTDVLEVYDPRQDTWEEKASLPFKVSGYALAAFEGKLFLFGGWDGTNYLNTVYAYDPNTDRWQLRSAMPTPRAFSGAAVVNERIYVLGGSNGTQSLNVNEVYFPARDDVHEAAWEKGAPLPESAFSMGAAIFLDNLYLLGGLSSPDKPSFPMELNTQDNTWSRLELSSPLLGTRQGLVVFRNELYVLGGYQDGGYLDLAMAYQAVYTIILPFQK